MARFVLPGNNPGLIVPGTIDIDHRPLVINKNGDVETVFSASNNFPLPGRPEAEMLYPCVVKQGGRWRTVSSGAAFEIAKRTGQHLGIFNTWQNAEKYGQRLHLEQAAFYRKQIAALRRQWLRRHRRRVRG